jgi:ElaB/YqjD/DUF883 family membrane-anchored ribosome-binding protein
MNTLKHLNKISAKLHELIEELDIIMDNIDKDELCDELDTNIRSNMEFTLTQLDLTIDDVSDGVYEKDPSDQEGEEWD